MGLGQLSVAKLIFEELKIQSVELIAVSKGKLSKILKMKYFIIFQEKIYIKK